MNTYDFELALFHHTFAISILRPVSIILLWGYQ